MNLLLAAAYTIAMGVCLAFAFNEARYGRTARQGTILLLFLSLILGVFALEQAFGFLGTYVTGTARQAAHYGGWYGQRRDLQKAIIKSIFPAGIAFLALLLWMTRRAGSRYFPLAVCMTYLIFFGALQAVSLHNWDARFRQQYMGLTLRTWGNAVGLGVVCLALTPLIKRKPQKGAATPHACTAPRRSL